METFGKIVVELLNIIAMLIILVVIGCVTGGNVFGIIVMLLYYLPILILQGYTVVEWGGSTYKAKSTYLTEEGVKKTEELMKRYNIKN